MANIPLPKQSDVKSATGYSQVDPSTGTAPYRALVGAGGAIAETGKTFDMFADKRQKLLNSGVEAEYDLALLKAQGDIDTHAAQNQHDPDSIRQFSDERLSRIWDDVKGRDKLDHEAFTALNQKHAYQTERMKIGVKNKVIQMEETNANTSIMNHAKFLIENGKIDEAVKVAKEATIPSSELENFLHQSIQGSLYSEVGLHLDSLGSPEELDEFSAEVIDKGDDDIYTSYTKGIDVGDGNKPIVQIASLTKGQRTSLARLAKQRSDRIKSQQHRNYSSLMKRLSKGDQTAYTELMNVIDNDDETSIPSEYIDVAEDKALKSIQSYTKGETIKTLEVAAKAADRGAYIELEANLAAASINPEGFDLKGMMDTIDDMDMEAPMKSKFLADALLVESTRYGMATDLERKQSFQMVELLPFVAVYKDIFGKESLRDQELETFSNVHKVLSKSVDQYGAYEGLPSKINDIQKKIYQFYRDNEQPSQTDIEQFESNLLMPLMIEMKRQEKYGTN